MARRIGDLTVRPLDRDRVADFQVLHAKSDDGGWCQCVAWWVPTWDGWSERTREQNGGLREKLFACGQYDGYLLYEGELPVGWMQVGHVGRLPKLWDAYRLEELDVSATDLAISCVFLDPNVRGRGWLHVFLRSVLDALAGGRGQVLAFPRRVEGAEAGEVWTGPESAFRAAGFRVIREDPLRPVLSRPLMPPGNAP